MLRGGWELPQRKSLLRNNCDGTFTDVTAASGLAEPATSTQTAAWADINNDGLLDLSWATRIAPRSCSCNKARGDVRGHLALCWRRSGRIQQRRQRSRLRQRRIRGPLRIEFQRAATSCIGTTATTPSPRWPSGGVPGPGYGFATWFFDYDNDGWPDLFATSYFTSVDESVRGISRTRPTTRRR